MSGPPFVPRERPWSSPTGLLAARSLGRGDLFFSASRSPPLAVERWSARIPNFVRAVAANFCVIRDEEFARRAEVLERLSSPEEAGRAEPWRPRPPGCLRREASDGTLRWRRGGGVGEVGDDLGSGMCLSHALLRNYALNKEKNTLTRCKATRKKMASEFALSGESKS